MVGDCFDLAMVGLRGFVGFQGVLPIQVSATNFRTRPSTNWITEIQQLVVLSTPKSDNLSSVKKWSHSRWAGSMSTLFSVSHQTISSASVCAVDRSKTIFSRTFIASPSASEYIILYYIELCNVTIFRKVKFPRIT